MPTKGWKKGDPTIKVRRNCVFCGKEFLVWPSKLKRMKNPQDTACSRACRVKHTTLWIDDTRYKTTHGYIMVLKPGIIKSSKLSDMLYEHRVIAEKVLQRTLTRDEEVHHINGIPGDNRLENLLVINQSIHKKFQRAPSIVTCEKCGHHNLLNPLSGGIVLAEVVAWR